MIAKRNVSPTIGGRTILHTAKHGFQLPAAKTTPIITVRFGFTTSHIRHFENNYVNVNMYRKYPFLQNVSRPSVVIAGGTYSRWSKFPFFFSLLSEPSTYIEVSVHLLLSRYIFIVYRVLLVQHRSNTVDYHRLRFISNTYRSLLKWPIFVKSINYSTRSVHLLYFPVSPHNAHKVIIFRVHKATGSCTHII